MIENIKEAATEKAAKLLDNFVEAVKSFEGLRLKAYPDVAGHWTIGYGHTRGVHGGQQISKIEAEVLLIDDLTEAVRGCKRLGLWLSVPQILALTDLIFNVGYERVARSKLVTLIRLRAPADNIRKEFMRWVYAGGKVCPGLVKRRKYDSDLWAMKRCNLKEG